MQQQENKNKLTRFTQKRISAHVLTSGTELRSNVQANLHVLFDLLPDCFALFVLFSLLFNDSMFLQFLYD